MVVAAALAAIDWGRGDHLIPSAMATHAVLACGDSGRVSTWRSRSTRRPPCPITRCFLARLYSVTLLESHGFVSLPRYIITGRRSNPSEMRLEGALTYIVVPLIGISLRVEAAFRRAPVQLLLTSRHLVGVVVFVFLRTNTMRHIVLGTKQ